MHRTLPTKGENAAGRQKSVPEPVTMLLHVDSGFLFFFGSTAVELRASYFVRQVLHHFSHGPARTHYFLDRVLLFFF